MLNTVISERTNVFFLFSNVALYFLYLMPFIAEHSEYFVGEKEISLATEFFSSPTVKLSYWKMEDILNQDTRCAHDLHDFWHSSIVNKVKGL